jgi:hypothetical protein
MLKLTVFHRPQEDYPPVKYRKRVIRNTLTRYRLQDFIFNILKPSYEPVLLEELFGLRTIVGYTMKEIYEMPVQERKFIINVHNRKIEEMNKPSKPENPMN